MNKINLKSRIVESLKDQKEIMKIIIFGSFNKNEKPNDLDIAIVQNSSESYLPLALKYRKLLRSISREIALDVFPVVENNESFFYINEIEPGEIIYERK